MGRFLKTFVNDELRVNAVSGKRSPEHQKIVERGYALHGKLEEKLNDEEKELLEELVCTLNEEGCRYAEDEFIRGYRLGVLMTMEVFSGQETFFSEGESK